MTDTMDKCSCGHRRLSHLGEYTCLGRYTWRAGKCGCKQFTEPNELERAVMAIVDEE